MLFNVNNIIKSCIEYKIVLGSTGYMVRYNIKIYCVKVCNSGLTVTDISSIIVVRYMPTSRPVQPAYEYLNIFQKRVFHKASQTLPLKIS